MVLGYTFSNEKHFESEISRAENEEIQILQKEKNEKENEIESMVVYLWKLIEVRFNQFPQGNIVN